MAKDHDPISPAHYRFMSVQELSEARLRNGDGLEVIDVIEACELGYHLGNAVKYILRAGKKGEALEDIKKAQWYLNRYIAKADQ